MKKLLLATAVGLGLVGAASAADLGPFPGPVPVRPVFMPAFNWTGCYLGGFLGAGWTAETVRVTDMSGYNNLPWDQWTYKTGNSFTGGGTAGCNWQGIGSPFVLGAEGELGYMKITGSAIDPYNQFTSLQSSIRFGDWYGMLTGRVGYAWDRVMLYVKGGGAFFDVQTTVTDPVFNPGFVAEKSEMKATWTLGGGLEWAFAPNWSVKAEYMFIGLDSEMACGRSGTFPQPGQYCFVHQMDGIHTAKLGLNYRFGPGAVPVIARY